jgi:hypothetical protein
MIGLINWMMAISGLLLGQTSQPAPGEASAEPLPERPLSQLVRAELRTPRTIVPVGSEVIVEFSIQNRTDAPVKLTVPGALPAKERTDNGMGLPLEHVFSGPFFRALEVTSEENPQMGDRVMRKPEYPVPAVTVAPFGTVGLRFDIARFYPGLHQSGKYKLVWKPYGGALESEPLVIDVVQYKQVTMETEYGSIVIEMLYDKAPRHVANFLELVEQRFLQRQDVPHRLPRTIHPGRMPEGRRYRPPHGWRPLAAGIQRHAI